MKNMIQTKERYKERNEKLAHDLLKFCEKNKIGDTSIYFNNKCIRIGSAGNLTILEDILGSNYFEYANDETVSMSFEGRLNHALNYDTDRGLVKKFNAIFAKHKCYYEFGYAWSLSVYYE